MVIKAIMVIMVMMVISVFYVSLGGVVSNPKISTPFPKSDA